MEKFRELTIQRLKKLSSSEKQLAFAYSACQRMLPNYQAFYKDAGWGDFECLEIALKEIREYILGNSQVKDQSPLLARIHKNIPDSDDFPNVSASYAQMAGSSVYYALNNLYNVNIEELSWAPVLSRDTVDAYVLEVENLEAMDKELESKIFSHSVMQRELKKQESDFLLLLHIKSLTVDTILQLTEYNNGRSNIDIRFE